MQLTLEADYAVRIVHALAAGAKRQDAAKLARTAGVTVRFALKILRKLVGAGLVRSFKGATGGYELSKAPEEVSLKDIIEAIEGPIHMARCVKGDYQCTRPKDGECDFQCVLEQISQDLREKLSLYTMDRFIRSGGKGS